MKILYLHGALGSAKDFERWDLSNQALTFPGHGGMPFDADFSVAAFAHFLAEHLSEPAHLIGYSMGGYVALYTALHHPEKVKSVLTLATKFNWNKEQAAAEASLLNPEAMQAKQPEYYKRLCEKHGNQTNLLLQKTSELLQDLGENPLLTKELFPEIKARVRICVGDRDKMVSISESLQVFSQIPNASFSVWPSTPHPIEKVNPELFSFETMQFLNA